VPLCTLKVGELTVLVADGGVPDVEYALFDPGEIQLHSIGPGNVREGGYQTHVRDARARLEDRGFTPSVADECARLARPWIARTYARCDAARLAAEKLESAELFDGGRFDAASGRYEGSWLDLPALAADLGVPGVQGTMQGIHLAALLAEAPADDIVMLSTAEIATRRRPGERTFKRVVLEDPVRLLAALRAFKSSPRQVPIAPSDLGPGPNALIDQVRARAAHSPGARDRLAALEAAMVEPEPPSRGPLSESELWAIEMRLSRGDAAGVGHVLDEIERRRGRLPGTIYLRARAALMSHDEEPRIVAERVSELSSSMPSFHELELLTAQAWTAAGDTRRAKAFARDLMDNAQAPEGVREHAREILRILATQPPTAPPPSSGAILPPDSQYPAIPRPPPTPSGVQDGLPVAERLAGLASMRASQSPPTPREAQEARERPTWRAPSSEPAAMPYRVERSEPIRARLRSSHPTIADETEPLEVLSLPPGMQGVMPPAPDEPPRTPASARVFCTLLTRELGRELRARHAVETSNDLEGLELAQRFLRERMAEGRPPAREDERELLRHGAFVSELLARRLGARWIDLEAEQTARWAMGIPTVRGDEIIRVWPFARVQRFATMGHRERDLVSYVLELEVRAR
jgi:hypothetical protein